MGQFELASALGAAPVPEPSSVELLAAACLLVAAWRTVCSRTHWRFRLALDRREPDRLRCSSRPG